MKGSKKVIFIIFSLLFVLAALAPAYYFYNKYQDSQRRLSSPAEAAAEELESTIKKVSNHIVLPQGEEPTLATVSDKAKLQNEPFFKKSENGDKVLVYTKTRKAYLYRPGIDKLIDVISLSETANTSLQVTPTPVEVKVTEDTVVIRNGTAVAGLTSTIESEITKSLPTVNVVGTENAARTNYAGTLVVAVNSEKKVLAAQIARLLNARVTQLPTGEERPTEGDVLVIIGSDRIQRVSTPIPTIQE